MGVWDERGLLMFFVRYEWLISRDLVWDGELFRGRRMEDLWKS